MPIVDNGRERCYFCSKGICGPKANNFGKCLLLLVTLFFIGKEWLGLFTLLNTGLSSHICCETFLKTNK